VLNLTNPRSHYEVTRRCLESGKHVYSEKPLAMDLEGAAELARMARQRRLQLACAPCSVLSESAQTVFQALLDGLVGRVRLVYANFDDGMIAPKMSPWAWRNPYGVPWPAEDEFEIGCTYEHAGYMLTWLAAFFGPARRVTAFSSCQVPDKGIPVESMAPDLSVACVEYDGGLVARLTCSLVAPKDKSLTIIGDDGILTVDDVRNDVCPVYLRPMPPGPREQRLEWRVNRLRHALRLPGRHKPWHLRRRLPQVRPSPVRLADESKPVDFCRGPAELAAAVAEGRDCRLSPELGVHIVELIEVLQYPQRFGGSRQLRSTFPPIAPLAGRG